MSKAEQNKKRKLWTLLIGSGVIFMMMDLFLHRKSHFGDYGIDGNFGFFGFLGFLGCIGLIFTAKLIGLILQVREDYYRD